MPYVSPTASAPWVVNQCLWGPKTSRGLKVGPRGSRCLTSFTSHRALVHPVGSGAQGSPRCTWFLPPPRTTLSGVPAGWFDRLFSSGLRRRPRLGPAAGIPHGVFCSSQILHTRGGGSPAPDSRHGTGSHAQGGHLCHPQVHSSAPRPWSLGPTAAGRSGVSWAAAYRVRSSAPSGLLALRPPLTQIVWVAVLRRSRTPRPATALGRHVTASTPLRTRSQSALRVWTCQQPIQQDRLVHG
ncbi:hypothetical protein NDU88_005654 [Pleurodeles waltl]|uniref:Uncharacterized protein n=1 Tax=Pleurodeles waltl TaxID=8319 RepID=A0AAV7UIQ3_PLEWA|nr:hypothetical protein NDU88_005654 [Pleurodeles waltl]